MIKNKMMEKQGASILSKEVTLLIIAVLVIFFVIPKLNFDFLKTSSIFRTSSEKTTKETTYYNTNTETEYIKTNLCNLFQPIIIAGDTVNQCNLNGGDWRCDADYIGCADMVNPVVDCSGAAVQYSMYQCQSVGGQYVCNPTNAYCYYA